MTTKTSYLPGEPIWSDLATPDQAASAAFYGPLFGWTATEPQPEFGGYASFLLDGRTVAGVMPLMAPDQAPSWSAYFCSGDADKTAALVEESGGTVVAPPMDVGELGRMAVFTDPAGTVFGVWQAGVHTGAELVDEEGAPSWMALTAVDPSAASGFYGSVLGWEANARPTYLEFTVAGRSVAGCTDPARGSSGWVPYFQVSHLAGKVEQTQALGGSLVLPLTSFDGGSGAIVSDPHGAVFGLLHTD